ncbi:proteasome subunit alpha [Cutibacterium equinum]|uniref:Proteasome subunit alpha n=1 Tax=Cutibacterium equinum TaxID=3016342 RepID=A0ABY7R0S5_9ACTN|nr:proteasome subunit alpha [Cutibacterium equinum]WCC80890.1 proteasome subunit alpha [Cutibacterium equinum]
MTLPAYVPVSQWVADRASFVSDSLRDSGDGVVVARCAEGIALVAHHSEADPPRAMRSISEIHDRLAFAGVGVFHETEDLRVAGIRFADLRAYAYDRLDVTGRSLASMYSRVIGTLFARPDVKPYQVQVTVAELGLVPSEDRFHTISFDGSVRVSVDPVVMGVAPGRCVNLPDHPTLSQVVRASASTLDTDPANLEVGLLDRHVSTRRHFRRLDAADVLETDGDES